MTEIDVRAFDQYEAAGWELVAAVYERVWSPSWRYRCGGDRARSASNRSGRCRRHEASITELPFADESFDAAVRNIVIQHVGEPERAARELARVLARGGRVALSTWDAPERSPFFAALLGAIADAQVPLRFGGRDGSHWALLRAADAAQRSAIRNSLDARLEEWRRGDRYVVPAPVKIASGRKPD